MRRLHVLSVVAAILAAVSLSLNGPSWSKSLAQTIPMGQQLPGFGAFTTYNLSRAGDSGQGMIVFTTQDGARRIEWSGVRWSVQDPRDGSVRVFGNWWGHLSTIQWQNANDLTMRSVAFDSVGIPNELRLVAYGPGGELLRSQTYTPSQPRSRWSGSCVLGQACPLSPLAMSGAGVVYAIVPGGGSGLTIGLKQWEFGGRVMTATFPKQQKTYAYDWLNRTLDEITTGTGTVRTMRWVDMVQAEGGSGSRLKVIGHTYAYPGSLREWVRLPSGTGMLLRVAYPAPGPLIVSTDDADLQAVRAAQGTTAMFRAAIEKVRRTKASVLTVASGTYVFERPDPSVAGAFVELSRLRDVTIDGQNSLFVFQGLDRSGMVIRNSDRVLLKNLRIDWADRLAVHAVVRRGSGASYFVVDDPAMPGSGPAIPDFNIAAGFDRVNNRWRTGDIVNVPAADFDVSFASKLSGTGSIEYAGKGPDGLHRYSLKGNPGLIARFRAVPDGTTMLLTQRTNGIYAVGIAAGSNDITIDGLTVYASPSGAFVANGAGRGIRLANSVVTRMPGRPYSTLADGFIHNSRGEVFMEGNRFDSNGDDGFNVNGYYPVIADIDASRQMLKLDYEGSAVSWGTGGDLLSFSDPRTLAPLGTARLVKAVEKGTAGCSSSLGICVLLASPAPIEAHTGALLLNTDRSTKKYIIRDNKVVRNRGRFILVQAEQGLIENNTGIAQELGGIYLINDVAYWMNGPGPSDVIVRKNVFENTAYGTSAEQRQSQTTTVTGYKPNAAILMMSRVPLDPITGHGVARGRLFHDILIESNVVRRTPGLGLVIESGRNITVKDNSFTETNTAPFAAGSFAKGAAMVMQASDVTFLGNVFSGQIFVDAISTDNVTIDGLLQP